MGTLTLKKPLNTRKVTKNPFQVAATELPPFSTEMSGAVVLASSWLPGAAVKAPAPCPLKQPKALTRVDFLCNHINVPPPPA